MHFGVPLAEARRHTDRDPHRKLALGVGNDASGLPDIARSRLLYLFKGGGSESTAWRAN